MEELKRPSEAEVAWFAGFCDGEGCIYLHRRIKQGNRISYNLQMQIGSTYFPVLPKIQEMWGAGRITQSYESRSNRKPSYFWVANANNALYILETIYPYLTIKRSDAEIAISFQRWKNKEAGTIGKTTKRTDSSRLKEAQMKDLLTNNRGNDASAVKQVVENILGRDNSLLGNTQENLLSKERLTAYFAGLFDAEGHVSMWQKMLFTGRIEYKLIVGLTNTNLPVVEKMYQHWGLGYVVTKEADPATNHKQYWKWYANDTKALTVLQDIYPYLVVKKADAEVGIAFQQWQSGDILKWGKYRPVASHAKEGKARQLLTKSRSTEASIIRQQIDELLNDEEGNKLDDNKDEVLARSS